MNSKPSNNYNIVIKADSIIYSTNKLFSDDIIKVPSYIVKELLEEGMKSIKLELNHKLLVSYTPEEFKRHIVTVESKLYFGKFKNEEIEYNLTQVKIVKK